MSRVRDCCVLAGISGISGGHLIFGCRMNLDHFLAWRAAINSRYSTGESQPIKAGQMELTPHLETTCEIHHINEEENVLISGTREKSAVGDSTRAETVAGCLLFQCRQYFFRRWYFTRCGDFNTIGLIFSRRKDFTIRLILSRRKDFTIHLIFTGRKDLAITLTFTGHQYLWIYLYIYFSVCALDYFCVFFEYAPIF